MDATGSRRRAAAAIVTLGFLAALATSATAQNTLGSRFDCPTEPAAAPASGSTRDYAALRAPTQKDDFCLKLDQGQRSKLELFGGARLKPEEERRENLNTDDARRRDVDGHIGLRLRLPLN